MNDMEKQLQTDQNSACEKTGCCSTTEDGNAVCIVPQDTASGYNTDKTIPLNSIQTIQVLPRLTHSEQHDEHKSLWQRIRGGVMFAVACIASPCCTPLIVPVVLSLLAGTPIAVLLGQNLGWVYGGLTLLSGVSFVLGWRWMGKNNSHKTALPVVQAPVTSRVTGKFNS